MWGMIKNKIAAAVAAKEHRAIHFNFTLASYAATAAANIILCDPTFHYRPTGLSLHAGLPT
jgi:hypothetical protein